MKNLRSEYFVYIARCRHKEDRFIKIGRSNNVCRRFSEIKSGCPLLLEDAFIITSEFDEEVIGLEQLLHYVLKEYVIHGEWYFVTDQFVESLTDCFSWINEGKHGFEDIELFSNQLSMESLEIILHRHNFMFKEIIFPLKRGVDLFENNREISYAQLLNKVSDVKNK